ncbi:transporter substrate-binding domain-containing protein [Leisingera sp. D0M16]|uniref:transporter substrate-binding domain-containing protein n=1 Tax=Leisingera coralii TaxID=3351347 RepID=UPI003B7EDDD0
MRTGALTFKSILGAAALALTLAPGAQADLLSDIKERGEFVAGTESRFPPFEFVEDGKIVGYSADIMTEIMKDLPGVDFRRLDLPWQGILSGLEAGKFDYVVTSVTITAERWDRYNMSRPIADATMAVMKLKRTDGIESPEKIAGLAVGTQAGTVHQATLEEYSKTLDTPITIKTYVDYNEAYADLAAGRIQAVANSLPNLLEAQRARPELFQVVDGTIGPKSYYGWVARKDADSASLAEFINAGLEKLQMNGKLAELQTKWFGAPMSLPEGAPQRPEH